VPGAGFERVASKILLACHPPGRAEADVGWRLLADLAVRGDAQEAARRQAMVVGVPRPLPGDEVGVAALLPVVQAEGDKLAPGRAGGS
jgi:hypothetical protein